MLDANTVDITELHRFQKLLIEDAINKWKMKLNRPSLPGRRVRMAILPHLTRWFNRSHVGGLTYRTTQILTDHGCFANFLHHIGKYQTPICGFCKGGVDDAQHTLQFCPNWEEYRNTLKNQIGESLELQTVVSSILDSLENWKAFQNFAEVVLTRKENKEREEEDKQRRTQDNRMRLG